MAKRYFLDVNILLYACRDDIPQHLRIKAWLENRLQDPSISFAVPSPVLSSFLRIATHPKIFKPPFALKDALYFLTALLNYSNVHVIESTPVQWQRFTALCQEMAIQGNMIQDVYLASFIATPEDTWVSCDQDYSLIPRVVCLNPLSIEQE